MLFKKKTNLKIENKEILKAKRWKDTRQAKTNHIKTNIVALTSDKVHIRKGALLEINRDISYDKRVNAI